MKAVRPLMALTLCLTLALPALAAPAASDDVSKLPGYVDLDWIQIPAGAGEIQDITLDPVLAGMAARSLAQKDGQGTADGEQALNQVLAMIKSVRVKSFSLMPGQDESGVAANVKKLQDKLTKDKWQRLIYVKDGEETVTVSTLYQGDMMAGLMILTYEPGDSATFVNVVGDLDLTTLLRLAGQMDGGQLKGMLSGLEGGQGHGKPEATAPEAPAVAK